MYGAISFIVGVQGIELEIAPLPTSSNQPFRVSPPHTEIMGTTGLEISNNQ